MNPKSRRHNPKIKLAREVARLTKPALKQLHLGDIVEVMLSIAAGYGIQCEDFNCEAFRDLAHELFHLAEDRLLNGCLKEPEPPVVTKKEPGLAN
jgi:hypothetical protein